MKKRIIAIATVLMMATAPAMAQIFMTDEDLNNRTTSQPGGMFVDIPNAHGQGTDYFAPVGEGLVVLAGLAGAYLLGKRRKEE